VAINGASFSLSGGYSGNQNEYWSGLPALFVALCAAWILRYKHPSKLFLISVNSIIIYWLSTGNRSEVLALFLYVNIFFITSAGRFRSEQSKNIAAAAVLLGGFFLFSAVGIIRSAGVAAADQSLVSMIFGRLVQEDKLSVST